jgi:hypothetical protein
MHKTLKAEATKPSELRYVSGEGGIRWRKQ